VIYQDTSDNGVVLPKTIVYDAWKAGPSPNVLEEMVSLIKQGYRTILANGPNGEWYLNDGFGNGNVVALWPAIYSMEPLNVTEKLTPDQQALILGGERGRRGGTAGRWTMMILAQIAPHSYARPL
jgi:hypothetical protein